MLPAWGRPDQSWGDQNVNNPKLLLSAVLAIASLGAVLTLAPVTPARAAVLDAEVEALQMPAWLTRGGKRVPLELGAQLKNGDTITTGEGSRVLLRMAEGSTVKLGENARFDLNDMAQGRERNQNTFKANLGVRQGAFRFTTAPEDKIRAKREIDVQFVTVTASIVGTDIWGKSGIERELVALVDGEVTVKRKGEPAVTMNEAKSVYIAPTDAPSRPVSSITLAQLNAFAQETEMQAGGGGAGRAGNWKVYAARTPSQEEAVAVYEQLRDAGFAAAVQQAFSGGKQIYQVRIAGLLSEADGVAVAAKLRIQLRLQNVSVSLN
jgi:hypothetical protein